MTHVAGRMLAWEFWRTRRGPMLAAVLGMTLVTLLIHIALGAKSGSPRDPQAVAAIHFAMLTMSVICFAAVLLPDDRATARSLRLPLSTIQLVFWRLTPRVLSVGVMYFLMAAMVNLTFELRWPYLAPALLLMATISWAHTAMWWTWRSMIARLFACAAVGFAALAYLSWIAGPSAGYVAPSLDLGPLLLMTASIAIGWLACIAAMHRMRRGESVDWSAGRKLIEWISGRLAPSRPFRSTGEAQWWFAHRRGGFALPWIVALLTSPVVLIFLYQAFTNEGAMPRLIETVALGAPCLIGVFGLHLGGCGNTGDFSCSTFRATLPQSDAAACGAIFDAAMRIAFKAWAVCAVLLATALAVILLLGGVETLGALAPRGATPFAASHAYYPLLLAASLVLTWTTMGLTVSLALTGRQWVLLLILIGGELMVLLGGAAIEFSPPHVGVALRQMVAWCLGVGLPSLLVTSLATARLKGLLGSFTAGATLAGWVVLCALFAAGVFWSTFQLSMLQATLFFGLLVLPFLPLPAAPLAFAWNRHR